VALRPHDLFRDFLQDRCRREYPGELPVLLGRAAESEPDDLQRVDYLLRAQAYAEATGHLMNIAMVCIESGLGDRRAELAGRFPADWRERSPELKFVRGLAAFHRWQFVTVVALMREATRGFELVQAGQLALRARAIGVIALFYLNRVTEAVA